MKNKRIIISMLVVLVLLLAGVAIYAADSYGSQSDPLITKSYLDSVVQPQMEAELKQQLSDAAAQMRSSTPGEFAELTLTAGQTLRCGAGCEILLRSGSASAAGELADTTAGAGVSAGSALSANHLYAAVNDSSGITAGSSVKALVSGVYSVE